MTFTGRLQRAFWDKHFNNASRNSLYTRNLMFRLYEALFMRGLGISICFFSVLILSVVMPGDGDPWTVYELGVLHARRVLRGSVSPQTI